MTNNLHRVDFYCDTSSHNKRFMVAGGVVSSPERFSEITNQILDIQARVGVRTEMKWSNFRAPRLTAYSELVDCFFEALSDKRLNFHCLICDFHKFDHRRHVEGRKDGSVSRLYTQLIVHRPCRYHGHNCKVHIYPDKGNDSAQLPSFKNYFGVRAAEKYPGVQPDCVHNVEPTDSESNVLVQLADIIVGAIAHHRNERHLAATCTAHKRDLAARVLADAGFSDWTISTDREITDFTVWNFDHTKLPPDVLG